MKTGLISLAFLGLSMSSALLATPLNVTSGNAKFFAKGKPGFMSINGDKGDITGTLDLDKNNLTADLKVGLDKFDTGIAIRDEHMKEKYLETKQFPDASLKITKFEVDGKGNAKDAPFTGTLKLHGVEHEVKGTASASTEGKKTQIDAKFNLLITDYKIPVPNWKGITVADNVDVEAKLDAEASAAPVAGAVPASKADAKAAAPAAKDVKAAAAPVKK